MEKHDHHVMIAIPSTEDINSFKEERYDGGINSKNRKFVKIFLSELLATTAFVFIAISGAAQVICGRKLSQKALDETGTNLDITDYPQYGGKEAAAFVMSLAYMYALFVTLGAGGGHVTPALTISLAIWRQISWKSVPFYLFGQFIGSILGILLVYSVYSSILQELDDKSGVITKDIFLSWPMLTKSWITIAWSLFISSSLFTIGVFAMMDRNGMLNEENKFLWPLQSGLLLMTLYFSTNIIDGTAFSPAMEAMTRLFLIAETKGKAELGETSVHLLTIFVPFLGSAVGGFLYFCMVGWYLPNKATEKTIIGNGKTSKDKPEVAKIDRVNEPEEIKRSGMDGKGKTTTIEYEKTPDYEDIAKYVVEELKNIGNFQSEYETPSRIERSYETSKNQDIQERSASAQSKSSNSRNSNNVKGAEGARSIKSNAVRSVSVVKSQQPHQVDDEPKLNGSNETRVTKRSARKQSTSFIASSDTARPRIPSGSHRNAQYTDLPSNANVKTSFKSSAKKSEKSDSKKRLTTSEEPS